MKTTHPKSVGRLPALAALVVGLSAFAAGDPPLFASPERAAEELARAAKASDPKALLGVLGPAAEELVSSGDAVSDAAERQRFVRSFEQRRELVESGKNRVVLEIGDDHWPFPIPLVRTSGGWQFDVATGKDELLNRRIGRNELSTIQSALAYVDAQREYYTRNPEGTGLHHYASKITSTPGKRDGLFWEARPNEVPSPLGAAFAVAQAEGYTPQPGRSIPYHGYVYRILTAQGRHAEGGAYDYLAQGALLGGFALVAYPAEYGSSGVMTFIVNHDGIVFERDLGPKTQSIVGSMKEFDPDKSWKRVEVRPPGA